MRFLLVLALALPLGASAQIHLSVESSKKTTETNTEQVTSTLRTTSYVDCVTLQISAKGKPGVGVELATYFVGRNVRTHALNYFGFDKRPLVGSVRVDSEPIAYSKTKRNSSTAESQTGSAPYGWVVMALRGGEELGVKASSPEVLAWVRKHPPVKGVKISP